MVALLTVLSVKAVQAQDIPRPPHVFGGVAVLDGAKPPPGTLVTAWDGDKKVGEATVGTGGEFRLYVSESEGPISFRIADVEAEEVHPAWEMGQATPDFELTAWSYVLGPAPRGPEAWTRPKPLPDPGPTLGPPEETVSAPAAGEAGPAFNFRGMDKGVIVIAILIGVMVVALLALRVRAAVKARND